MRRRLIEFASNEIGATAIEYGLIGLLIALAIVIGATTVGADLGAMFQGVGNKVSDAAKNVPQ